MHHQIDSLAYTNRLRHLPPEHKSLFAIALFALGYAAPLPVQLAIAGWLAVWIVGYAGIPAAVYGKLLVIPMGFWLASVPALVLGATWAHSLATVQGDAWRGIVVGSVYVYLSHQGIAQGVSLLGRAIALTSCLYFLLLTVPFAELLRLLRRLGCPALIAELLGLMYRFIFLLTDIATELLTAQRARLGYRTWRTSMRSLSVVVSQLLQRTLDNYRQISLGLAARGFAGEVRLWHSRRYRCSVRHLLEAAIGYLVLLAAVGWHHAPSV